MEPYADGSNPPSFQTDEDENPNRIQSQATASTSSNPNIVHHDLYKDVVFKVKKQLPALTSSIAESLVALCVHCTFAGICEMKFNEDDHENENDKGQKQGQGREVKQDQQIQDKDMITVVFNAVSAEGFVEDNEEDFKVVIHGDQPVFRGWENGSGIPVTTKRFGKKQWLLQAVLQVPLKHIEKKCAYKYALLSRGEANYELLVEVESFFNFLYFGYINRCLYVPTKYHRKNKIYYKYDGFVYKNTGLSSKYYEVVQKDREEFLQRFFPRWIGFFNSSENIELMQPDEAMERLHRLFLAVTEMWISKNGEVWKQEFSKPDFKKVVTDLLMPKVESNCKVLKNGRVGNKSNDIFEALVSSAMIASVFGKCKFTIAKEEAEEILRSLKFPVDQSVCVRFMETINAFDQQFLSSFIQSIFKIFYRFVKTRSLLDWLNALPLLHFLRKECEPFKEVLYTSTPDFEQSRWWGLQGLDFGEVKISMGESDLGILPKIEKMFRVDPLLRRTYLLLCPLKIFGDLLKEKYFTLPELCFTIRKLILDVNLQDVIKHLEDFFEQMSEVLFSSSPTIFTENKYEETKALLSTLVWIGMSLKCESHLQQIKFFCCLAKCIANAINLQKRGIILEKNGIHLYSKSTPLSKSDVKDMWNFFEEIFELTKSYFYSSLSINLEDCKNSEWQKELRMWNELLSFSGPDLFQNSWRDEFMAKLIDRVKKVSPLRQIELLFLKEKKKLCVVLSTCLRDAAFEAVEKVVITSHSGEAFEYLSQENSTKAMELLSVLLYKAWPDKLREEGASLSSKEKEKILLNHLLNWSVWPGFFKLIGSNSESKELIKAGACGNMITRAQLYLVSLIKSVRDGTVTVKVLELLMRNSAQFLKLAESYGEIEQNYPTIEFWFQERVSELTEFKNLHEQLMHFMKLTKHFTSVDEEFSNLREKVAKDYDELPLCQIVKKNQNGALDFSFFETNTSTRLKISKIMKIEKSRIFWLLWKNYGEKDENEEDDVGINLIAEKVGKIEEKLETVNKNFFDGEMKLKETDKILSSFKMCYDSLEEEFRMLSNHFGYPEKNDVDENLKSTLNKLKKYKELFELEQCAGVILKLRHNYVLTGDFSEVENIAQIISSETSSDMCVNDINDKLLSVESCLKEINSHRKSCLKVFAESVELVLWVRKFTKDEKELKVFIDLAMISAGESDLEIDRISCMHTSCLGFSSLIFGYREEHGFRELMDLCKRLWQVTDANPTIDKKLETTQKNLFWLKQIKESHGSVAMTTMVQVEAINSCEDADRNREEKIYSLDEIKDIQSKLMLIAGKAESGKEEVDQFNEVFEQIQRLNNLYLQLCEVGEISYLTWKSDFRCSKQKQKRENRLYNIRECCEKMEKDLKKWKLTMSTKRQKCYSLNHFTMKQILTLRKELFKACVGETAVNELPRQIFVLLQTVKNDIDPIILAEALMIQENSLYQKGEDVPGSCPTQRQNSFEVLTSAKEIIESEGYDEDYILAALQVCGRKATDDSLVEWVFDCNEDKDTIFALSQKAKENPNLSDLVTKMFSTDSHTEHDITLPTRKNDKAESFHINNEDTKYLSLDNLAALLEKISEKERSRVDRNIPTVFKEGEPNLLLVSKGEVFGCVLSLFMGCENVTLPSDEEVVVCDQSTTSEEIELLWRRAVGDNTGRLFCLVNADLLDFDVSQEALRLLESLTQGQQKYRLVVVCSIENDKSNIVKTLDHYRRSLPPLKSLDCIQRYLKEKFVYQPNLNDHVCTAAAIVDREKLLVRFIKSSRAGMGKSLIVKRLTKQLESHLNNKRKHSGNTKSPLCCTIPVHGVCVNENEITRNFFSHMSEGDAPVSRIFHLDISQSVSKGLDDILFKLLILGSVKDNDGNIWRRKTTDLYVVEHTTDEAFVMLTSENSSITQIQNSQNRQSSGKYSFMKFLPSIHCLSPRETLRNLQLRRDGDTSFDKEEFKSDEYQRALQYLLHVSTGANLDNFSYINDPRVAVNDPNKALTILIQYCGIRDPSWAEIHHFVNFLNVQLRDCEKSVFCHTKLVGDVLQGFKTFVVCFMIQMSRDFATRSLIETSEKENDDLQRFQIRRCWEKSPHPYIFFHHDHNSMTFLGFLLNENGDLVQPGSKIVLKHGLMPKILRGQLKVQGVDFDVNYESSGREARIKDLCKVMGINHPFDPDPTYELTTDNMKKILAIHMRFRCGIPVIVMGETGCGKTSLIRFMCQLQAGRNGSENLILMKVHGGTSYKEIEKNVAEAEKLALRNQKINVNTILFFDEANTTDAIDLIKEIMVDRRVKGRYIDPTLTGLHFIAACNPYRKHTDEMIKKLESAGLGYHVSADETEDKLGSIPLRQLVYRVHPLPESMRPLVWDFGQLSDDTEKLYTKQIVERYVTVPSVVSLNVPFLVMNTERFKYMHSNDCECLTAISLSIFLICLQFKTSSLSNEKINGTDAQVSCIAKILSASQDFMREQKNECSFVSLRDVERSMTVINWFYNNYDLMRDNILHSNEHLHVQKKPYDSSDSKEDEEEEDEDLLPLNRIVFSIVQGIGVCYYARLNERHAYCRYISRYFDNSCPLPGGDKMMKDEIVKCQRAFLYNVKLDQNIARNNALCENVFMMAICAELRLPLFVVGKPGSSKSLAKDVISSNMQGGNSSSELFKKLKQIHMQSYQCSPLSTPDGIISIFKQCSQLQKDKDLSKFVSVVVLDEIGLAEDSPLMPLKTLHPLLEDGTATSEEYGKELDHNHVGFIGLSNWALDPAKMNRGIMLTRGTPSEIELLDIARGICSWDEDKDIDEIMKKLCDGYFDLYEKQKESRTLKNAQKDEFFGLRDFYSLVKMVNESAKVTKKSARIDDTELKHCILRNFSGLDDVDPVEIFSRQFRGLEHIKNPSTECLPINLLQNSLRRTEKRRESRYLLVLTENYAALRLLQSKDFREYEPEVIFGSSFPRDQQYTQICRNINRIKVCMETGRMVILLNLESLYESLYDALNQYYLFLDQQKYVDLGLGNHRVKCRVADNFKLIVIAEKNDVYQRFPIPLINRLEKHLLVMSTGLTQHQNYLVKELKNWIIRFSTLKTENSSQESLFRPGDCFVGYHSDTAATVVLQNYIKDYSDSKVLEVSKKTLLQCASPDAIARLTVSQLKHDACEIHEEYYKNQQHGTLKNYLVDCFQTKDNTTACGYLVQVTTYSRLLSEKNALRIADEAGFPGWKSRCIRLQEFQTEQQFVKTLENFFVKLGGEKGLLLVQCDDRERNFNLIACSRYLLDQTRRKILEMFKEYTNPIHIIFIIQLPKISGGCHHFVEFQGGKWQCVHIDELLETNEQLPQLEQLVNHSVSDLFNLNESNAQKIEENLGGKKRRLTLLLKKYLQSAASRVFDESIEDLRTTKRIEILQKCFVETDLSTILILRIHQLLLERDKECSSDQKLWVQEEALSQRHLQETGTFRKALCKKISSIVSPILSEVIAYCDRNHNLNLLLEANVWTRKLWLEMLKEDSITTMTYESFISPVSGRIRERATVLSIGVGHRFEGKFPFSWIIKDIVQDLLLKVGGDITKRLESLRSIFDASPLGILIKLAFEEPDVKEEAAKNYLNDFLHMMYKPVVKNELKLIYDAVLATSRQIHKTFHEDDKFHLDIPLIHFAYSMIQERLLNFSEIVHAFPQLVEKLMESPSRINETEMCLDAIALHCCLEELEPNLNDLKNLHKRKMWCNQVQCLHPIIQDMKTLLTESGKSNNVAARLSKKSSQILEGCWNMFTRLDVVRMFIEHTCPPEELNHTDDGSNALKLWKELGESPVFTSLHTIDVIDEFLKECSEELQKREIKFDAVCAICITSLHDPVQLPCGHVYCKLCITRCLDNHKVCPVCRYDVSYDFQVKIDPTIRLSLEEWKSFRNRFKSFFMNVVSVYCFGDDLPQKELLRKFMYYVIKDGNVTEDFTHFDGHGIDVTPVIRSYILQQLLSIKKRESEADECLEEYLSDAKGLSTSKEHLMNVCMLFVHCIEDSIIGELLRKKQTKEKGKILEIKKLHEILDRTLKNFQKWETLDIDSLKDIAAIRAALTELSTFINDDLSDNLNSNSQLRNCFEAAKHLSREEKLSALHLFLLKQLIHNDPNGFDGVKERCKNTELKWILPPQIEKHEKTLDSFIVHDDDYYTVRKAIGKGIMTSNYEEMQLTLKKMTCDAPNQFFYILLAFYGEVKMKFSSGSKTDRISLEMVNKKLGECVTEHKLPLAKNLLENFNKSPYEQLLQLHSGQTLNDRHLNEILIHFLVVLSCFPNNQLLAPLSNLAFNPGSMRNAYIPTMPHDDGPKVMDVSYESNNAHHHVITVCGEYEETYNSLNSGAAIEEENSHAHRSSTGHILGRVQNQPTSAERNLNSLSCSVLRCLTHVAMLLGTTPDQIQNISAIVIPPVDDIIQFIKDHIKNDLRCIARFVGTNVDEAAVIIHLIFVEIVKNNHGNIYFSQTDWSSKETRQTWENAFMKTYLNPVLSVVSELLRDGLSKMISDERLGNNELLKLIYELDEPNSIVVKTFDPSCPALWRNRKKITIEHLFFKYQEYSHGVKVPTDKCEVLDEFLKKECHLRALQYLPKIIKLQRFLFEKFHRRLDRNDAEKYTIGDLYKKEPDLKKHLSSLIDDFRKAWKIIRISLVQNSRYGISKELSEKEVTSATPISMLLPSWKGFGKCSLALTNYLVSLHNDFIGRCKSLLNDDEKNSEELSLSNVTKGHLVAYDTERDFLPMVLAHCDYSVKVAEETEETAVKFNWKSLERQLVDRFIRRKPRIACSFDLFVFSKDICDGAVFKALSRKIPQVTLTQSTKDHILSELNRLTDVCDVLKSLHDVIGFLSSAGGDPVMFISEYMQSALKLDPKKILKSGKAEQFCQLQHVVALWKLLSLERARILTENNQDPFDDVTDNIKTALGKQTMGDFCRGLHKIKIDRFVDELLHLILLFLKNAQGKQLHHPLAEYINRKLEQDGCTLIEDLRENLPDEVTVAHAVDAWRLAYEKSDYHSNYS
ncbi:E3 ubiquitin-protein ligase rnf213-alpha-like [Xenia sp. Carnegie-2017]|uniref:E3 ubiquitin-protein ligase rnf213-alpha-like n=1 Tax=Xenia sp. Carnegie-2017 TaxID=2897299 RepID=UPI001F03C645|nr:E3 ubiquitin-protein ligase rnf213-alpha-like [Xenia sp. Carnegie-2017]